MTNERVFKMPFSNTCPMPVRKAERKRRTKEKVDAEPGVGYLWVKVQTPSVPPGPSSAAPWSMKF